MSSAAPASTSSSASSSASSSSSSSAAAAAAAAPVLPEPEVVDEDDEFEDFPAETWALPEGGALGVAALLADSWPAYENVTTSLGYGFVCAGNHFDMDPAHRVDYSNATRGATCSSCEYDAGDRAAVPALPPKGDDPLHGTNVIVEARG